MMIDKRELKIGNLVYVDGHREMFFTILQLRTKVAVVKGHTTFQAEYEILTPVQLTRKILEEQQFIGKVYMEKQIGPNLILSVSTPDDFGRYQLSLSEGVVNISLLDDGYESTFTSSAPKSSVRLLPIQYLHQLQNTYYQIGGMEMI